MGYPRFQMARGFKWVRRTSGNLTLNNVLWTNLDTGTDLVVAASVGDVLEVSVNIAMGNEAVAASLDVVTVVSGTPYNSFYKTGGAPSGAGGSDLGIAAWFCDSGGPNRGIGAPVHFTVSSGDIVSGTVTLRLRYFTSTSAPKTLYSSTTSPLEFFARNIGPVDPN